MKFIRLYRAITLFLVLLILGLGITSLCDAVGLQSYPKFKAWDTNGVPLTGGKLYSYVPGTDTLKNTYSDHLFAVPNTNPVILNSLGEATVYLNGATRLVLKTSADVTLWDIAYVGEYDVTIDTKVSKTGNETIAGTKTFSSFPVTPSAAPTVNYQVANKKFVDDSIAGVVKEKYALLQEQQASGVAGGTFTSGAWRTRTLNTEVADLDGIVSLAANQFTLAAGTYRVRATAPGHVVDQHKLALYNISDAAYTAYGTSSKASSTSDAQTYAELITQFTVAVPKIFELHHRCTTTAATNGFGRNCGFGVIEIYAQVEIWKAN